MALPDTWQTPTADDIDPDSLEYLFGPKKLRGEAPWVRMVRDPEPVARISPEMVRLQAKLEIMLSQLEIFTNKLAKANLELGMARAELADKDEQLKLQQEYRARAAAAVMSDLERRRLLGRIEELERDLAEALSIPSAFEMQTSLAKLLRDSAPLPPPPSLAAKQPEVAASAQNVVLQNHYVESAPSVVLTTSAARAQVEAAAAAAGVAVLPADRQVAADSVDNLGLERALLRHGDQGGGGFVLPLMPVTYLAFLAFALMVLHLLL